VPEHQEVVDGYARALLEIAEAEGERDAIVDQLWAFGAALEREGRLREALIDPNLPVENKKALVADVLRDRANPNVVHMIGFVVEQGRARELSAILRTVAAMAAERREHVIAEVRSAVPLDAAQRQRLAAALSTASGRTVEVKVIVDPSVMGGLVARIGDTIYDGSVRTRLDEAREHITSA
jgi:F-type H+-transporting ATPase subunit delta